MVWIDLSVALTDPNSLEKVPDKCRRQFLSSEVSWRNQGSRGGFVADFSIGCLGISELEFLKLRGRCESKPESREQLDRFLAEVVPMTIVIAVPCPNGQDPQPIDW